MTQPPTNSVVVHGGATGFAQDIRVGAHRLQADEPTGADGTDTGPSPYDFLLAALGSCTSMTLRMYADRKQWPLQGVTVHLHHEKIHAEDCAECETRVGRIDHIERRIELAGPLEDSQRQRLLEIARMCPVHRTLKAEIQITTTLV
jgi:putative redox protein